jgi:hypothetical protein
MNGESPFSAEEGGFYLTRSWAAIAEALRNGGRGLPGGTSSCGRKVTRHRGWSDGKRAMWVLLIEAKGEQPSFHS